MKFAEYINEAKLIDDLDKLEKVLPNEFNMYDFLHLQKNLGIGYGGSWGRTIYFLAKKAGVTDQVVMRKSAYVSYGVWKDENGYGNYEGTTRKEYQEAYDILINGDEDDMIELLNYTVSWAEFQKKKINHYNQ